MIGRHEVQHDRGTVHSLLLPPATFFRSSLVRLRTVSRLSCSFFIVFFTTHLQRISIAGQGRRENATRPAETSADATVAFFLSILV